MTKEIIYSTLSLMDPINLRQIDDLIDDLKEKKNTPATTPSQEDAVVLKFPTKFEFKTWPQKDTPDRAVFITFIDQFFHEWKKLPVKEDFENHFSLDILPKSPEDWKIFLLDLHPFLEARGLPFFQLPLDVLEPQFVLAVTLITNPHDKKTVPAKLQEAGLTTKQWHGFLQIPEYRALYQQRLDEIFTENTPNDAKLALQKMIAGGDLQAIKFFYELQNIYRPQENTNKMIVTLLQGVMEVLAAHVTADVLNKVAAEIRPLMQKELTA